MSRWRSTVASFSGFTQRIRRRQFVDEKLWRLLVGTPLNFGKLPVEDYREPSRRALEQATARSSDENLTSSELAASSKCSTLVAPIIGAQAPLCSNQARAI